MESRASCSVLRASCVAFCVAVALPVLATTYYVDPKNGDDGWTGDSPTTAFKSFSYAVAQMAKGDTLMFLPGTNTLTSSSTVAVSGLSFIGMTGNRDDFVIDGGGKYRMLRQTADDTTMFTFANLTVINTFGGSADEPGGTISLFRPGNGGGGGGRLTISNCVFRSCRSTAGTCTVFSSKDRTFVYDTLFDSNVGEASSGLTTANGSSGACVSFIGCTFTNNYANQSSVASAGNGGAIELYGCHFFDNKSKSNGGCLAGHVNVVSNCLFVGNCCTNGNGGVYQSGNITEDNVVWQDSVFSNNWAKVDGGVFSASKHFASFSGCDFVGNRAETGSGGALNVGALTVRIITNCTFVANLATNAFGGAIYGDIGEMVDVIFDGNRAKKRGGAWNDESDLADTYVVGGKTLVYPRTIRRCTFCGNQTGGIRDGNSNFAAWAGGAISFSSYYLAAYSYPGGCGRMKFCDCSFTDNAVTNIPNITTGNAYHFGGAVFAPCGAAFERCGFTNNWVMGTGGAIYGSSTGGIRRCSFVRNGCLGENQSSASGKDGFGAAVALGPASELVSTNGSLCTVFEDTEFVGNTNRGICGSAIWVAQGGLKAMRCDFRDNANVSTNGAIWSSGGHGGCIAFHPGIGPRKDYTCEGLDSPFLIDSCRFVGNVSPGKGAAIMACHDYLKTTTFRVTGHGTIRNCLFANNVVTAAGTDAASAGFGGAIAVFTQDVDVVSCTFTGNRAAASGGAYYNKAGEITGGGALASVSNCVFFGNAATSDPDLHVTGATVDNLAYTFAPTDAPLRDDAAYHNILSDENPFRSDDHTDLAVKKDCGAGVGLPLDWMVGARDLGGKPRLAADDSVDFGCYQFWRKPGLLLFVW